MTLKSSDLSTRQTPRGTSQKRRTQEERREETRGRLLDAAIRLLGEKGYSRFRITEAAQSAGVSRGGQTHHFATKNDLVEAAIEHVFESATIAAQVEANQHDKGSVLNHAVDHSREFFGSKSYRVSLNMLISAGADAHLAERIRTVSLRARPPIERAWIDLMVRSGVPLDTAEDALWTAWSLQRGIMHDEIIETAVGAPEDLFQFALDLIDRELPTGDGVGRSRLADICDTLP